MGAFNIIYFVSECPSCKRQGSFCAQFKYGDTWQHRYKLGDVVKWGGNDIGEPTARRVRVEAVADPCEYCGTDNLEFDIIIEKDTITQVIPVGIVRKNPLPDGFQIIES